MMGSAIFMPIQIILVAVPLRVTIEYLGAVLTRLNCGVILIKKVIVILT